MAKKVLVTGGAGFIGSNFVRLLLNEKDIGKITILDKLTYAGSLDNLSEVLDDSRIEFVKGDIANPDDVAHAMDDTDWIVNFAAESHVDRSLADASPFMRSNIEGVRVMLEIARWVKPERFLHISTDEVYGPVLFGSVDENALLRPSSPYSASKAAADMFCNAYFATFDVPVIIARSANNYGQYQYPEKLIPRFVMLANNNEKLPLYGDGKNVRDWLYVEDNCRAILTILQNGESGEIYNIGASELHENIEISRIMLDILQKPHDLITHVSDRLGHDRRYCVNWDKIAKLGWQPTVRFEDKYMDTVLWYQQKQEKLEQKSQEAERFYQKN